MCLISIFACISGLSDSSPATPGAVSHSHVVIPLLGGMLLAGSGIVLGWRFIHSARAVKCLILLATAAGILWWIARDGRVAAAETLLLLGFAVWSPLYLLRGRSEIGNDSLDTPSL